MLLRFSSQISTVNGICGRCDHSIKWFIIRNISTANKDVSLRNETMAQPNFKNGRAIN